MSVNPYLPKFEMSNEELEKKSTERLLNIFRKVSALTRGAYNIGRCECCGIRYLYGTPEQQAQEEALMNEGYEAWKRYRERIRAILEKRPNVSKPYEHKLVKPKKAPTPGKLQRHRLKMARISK